jgi:hypothetical protein
MARYRLLFWVGVIAAHVSACVPIPEWRDAPIAPVNASDRFKPGDTVRIESKASGKRYVFEVVEVKEEGFRGSQGAQVLFIKYANIKSLEVERIGWHKLPSFSPL